MPYLSQHDSVSMATFTFIKAGYSIPAELVCLKCENRRRKKTPALTYGVGIQTLE